jgi:outer membrane protein
MKLATAICVMAVAVATTSSVSVHAQGLTEARISELTNAALHDVGVRASQTGSQQEAPVVRLTADDAVRMALQQNLDIRAQRLEPQLSDLQVAGVLATYRPSLTTTFFSQGATSLPTSQLQALGGTSITNDTVQWNAGLSQSVRNGGGSFALNVNNARVATSDTAATRNPAYTANVQAQYTQPLMRGFRTDPNRSGLLINRIQQQITDLNLRSTLTITEANVRTAYWDLVFATENVAAAQSSVDLATRLVQDNRTRTEIGTMAPIDIVSAQAEEASRRQTLVAAEATRSTSELALKRLLVSGTDDPLWDATLHVTDRPVTTHEPVDVRGAVRNALLNRIDLVIARKNVEQNTVSVKNLSNQTLPDLNLVGIYNLAGRGGPEFQRSGIGGAVTNTVPGGYFDALTNIGRLDAPTWSVRVNFTYWLGRNQADVNYARARVQVAQTQLQLKQAELIVATEVANAALNVRNTQQGVVASEASRILAEQRLEAAQRKLDVGTATSFEVVQAQRDLADARTTELRSLLNHQKAIVDLERSQITGTSRTVTTVR